MSTRAQTLRTFADLLAAPGPLDIAAAEAAVWSYLVPFQGLGAQESALVSLREGLAGLDANAAALPALVDLLDRHRARLAEGRG